AQVFGRQRRLSGLCIAVFVHGLRKKLDGHAVAIVTFRGLGYLLENRNA
ncbi:DNA-binding response regulator, partial [Pseudomonas ogarae]